MSWEILVDEEDLELWGVRIQVCLLQSPLITLLIVKASPPLQTTTFCVNTENCPKTECSQHRAEGNRYKKSLLMLKVNIANVSESKEMKIFSLF